jgi:hypothetical protein
MDNLKNFIDQNREEFESEQIQFGHKERFFEKVKESNKKRAIVIQMPYWAKLAVASAILLLLAVPLFVKYRLSEMESGEYYIEILNEQSMKIQKMAGSLSPDEKLTVESTIRQLNDESTLMANQLPSSMSSREKRKILKGYYTEKIEGGDKLVMYVESLVK